MFMPWRLIQMIIIFAILLIFIGFNLTNTCDISLGFMKIPNVPVYLTVFASFMLGMLSSVPFFIIRSIRKKHKMDKALHDQHPHDTGESQTTEPYGVD